MRDSFIIKGLFYELAEYKCRKYLDIKRKSSTDTTDSINIPDLMIVMMNPGSSYPIDGIENNTIESEAIPDRTQDQIMRVMNDSNFNYARVLNLSDLRTPKSPVLYKFLKSEKSSLVAHSIFDAKRKADLDELFVHNVPVIFGWGVNKSLTCLAKQAIQSIKCDNPIGLKKNDSDVAYYHPLPRVYSDQIEWVNAINGMLAAHRKRCRN